MCSDAGVEPTQGNIKPEHNSENFQRIVGRMAIARWISNNQVETPEMLYPQLTDRGRTQMSKAAEAIMEAAPHAFKAEATEAVIPKELSLLDGARLTVRVSAAVRELTKPDMSDGEADALMDILLNYAWKLSRERLSQPPKSPPE